jgi:mRNA-degrading endonuclease RelE of RelBE toxin-antitoxin system
VSKAADNVNGTIEFTKFFDKIPESEPRKKELRAIFKTLKDNYLSGNKIPHKQWPHQYIKKYNIMNLWRFEMKSGWRLIYTIIAENDTISVCVIEAFSHDDYEKRFNY